MVMKHYIKGRMQAKIIWKQNSEASVWAQEEWLKEVEKAVQPEHRSQFHRGRQALKMMHMASKSFS